MEAIGGASAIIAVVEIAAALFQTCLEYSLKVKDAKKDIQRLQQEAFELQTLLARVADLANEPKADQLPALQQVLADGGPLETCKSVMKELLHQLGADRDKPEMRRFGLRAFKWPFKSEEVDSTLIVLERCKSSFNLALATDQIKLALNTNQETETYRKGQYKEKIVAWLANVEVGVSFSNHEDARKKHEDGTGLWLLQGEDTYQSWKTKSTGGFLWVHGTPGCGKTIMISSIIEDLRPMVGDTASYRLAYFYFDFQTPAKQNVLSCARHILSRIINQGGEEITPELKNLYIKKCNYGHEEPTLADVSDILIQLISSSDVSKAFIVLDGLDEAPIKDHDHHEKRAELMKWLVDLTSQLSDKLYICASSRPEPDIKSAVSELSDLFEIDMDEDKVSADINLHVQRSVQAMKKIPQPLKVEITNTLLAKAQGMFRWVDCQLQALEKCKTKAQVSSTLKNLPATLPDTYARILLAISDEDADHAKRALWWLITSRRPLTIEELAEAAVIDLSTEPAFDADYRFFDTREHILEILGSLIAITSASPSAHNTLDILTPTTAMPQAETVRLSHFSVQEYLLSNQLRNCEDKKLRSFGAELSRLNSFISESSLQYLHCYISSDARTETEEDATSFPLLCYAAQRWTTLMSASAAQTDDERVSDLAIRLLQDPASLEAWLKIYAPNQRHKKLFTMPEEVGEPIHYAASLGLNQILSRLVERDQLDARTESGITPLIWSCSYKQLETMQTLISHGADVNAQKRGGRAALHEAASKGSLIAVHHLVRAGATVDIPDCDGWTPFYYACEGNQLDVAKYLLQDRTDPKISKLLEEKLSAPFDRTPDQVAKADPRYRTNSGGSALHQVAGWGYTEVAKLLLKHGADVNIATAYGATPLHQAAGGGAKAVVALLLEAGADPHVTNLSGYTARDLAEDDGKMDVAEILMEAEARVPRNSSVGEDGGHDFVELDDLSAGAENIASAGSA